MTENEIIAQAHVFFVAGYETTATALSWTAFELALNPSTQDKLYEEVVTAVDSNGDLDYDMVARLPYLDAVVSETLRLHNPAGRLNRVCVEETELAGIKIPVDFTVEMSVHSVHHCEEYFPNAYKFDPERFMPENRHNIKPYTYLPFGAGPRSCIGLRFALMETKIAIAYVIRQFRFSKSPNTSMKPETKHVFLNTPADMILYVEKR